MCLSLQICLSKLVYFFTKSKITSFPISKSRQHPGHGGHLSKPIQEGVPGRSKTRRPSRPAPRNQISGAIVTSQPWIQVTGGYARCVEIFEQGQREHTVAVVVQLVFNIAFTFASMNAVYKTLEAYGVPDIALLKSMQSSSWNFVMKSLGKQRHVRFEKGRSKYSQPVQTTI